MPDSVASDIETCLSDMLPAGQRGRAASLAAILAGLALGDLTREAAEARLAAEPALADALRALAGKEARTPSALISFGEGNQLGDVSIGDVAGGSILKLTIIGQQFVYTAAPVQPDQASSLAERGRRPLPRWQRALIAVAAALVALIALVALLYSFAFDPIIEWAARTFAPTMRPADAIRVSYNINSACASAASVEESIQGVFGGRASTRVQIGQGLPAAGPDGPDLQISWDCTSSLEQPIQLQVTFLRPPYAPIALLEEPTQISLATTVPAARAIGRVATLYAAGAYAAALEDLGSYGQESTAEAISLSWLRANLLLRAERWDEAVVLFDEVATLADSELRTVLLGNQAATTLYAREAQGLILNNSNDCAAAGQEAISQVLGTPGLADEQAARLKLLSAWRMMLCPMSDEEMFFSAPATISDTVDLLSSGSVLYPILVSLKADSERLQDLPDDEMQGRVEDLALQSIAEISKLPQPYRTFGLPQPYLTLGVLYADVRRMDEAKNCFVRYASIASLPYQRRNALLLTLSTWKWSRRQISPRPDLRVCPDLPS